MKLIKNLIFNYKNHFSFPQNASEGITPKLVRDFRKYRKLPLRYINEKICYAPFKSLYMGHGGKIFTCCYNRKYVLGTYPKQTLEEIWFGEKANELRKAISEYDMSYGCNICSSMLTAGNFSAVKAKQYDRNKMNRNKYPSVIEFELSNECNLGCIMCSGEFSSYIRKHIEGKEPIPAQYDNAFLLQLREFIPHLEEAKFFGGEPFLIPIYLDIWDLIMELNPKCSIILQTNATILSERVKKLLEKGNFKIGISLDSLQKDTYESIRRNAKYDKVMENIRYFRDYTKRKKTFFGISVCMMRNNWTEAADFVRYCNSLNADLYFHTVLSPHGLALNSLSAQELKDIYQQMGTESFNVENSTHKRNVEHFKHWLLQIKEWQNKAEQYDFLALLPVFKKHIQENFEGDTANMLNVKLDIVSQLSKRKWRKEEINSKIFVPAIIDIFLKDSIEDLIKKAEADNLQVVDF